VHRWHPGRLPLPLGCDSSAANDGMLPLVLDPECASPAADACTLTVSRDWAHRATSAKTSKLSAACPATKCWCHHLAPRVQCSEASWPRNTVLSSAVTVLSRSVTVLTAPGAPWQCSRGPAAVQVPSAPEAVAPTSSCTGAASGAPSAKVPPSSRIADGTPPKVSAVPKTDGALCTVHSTVTVVKQQYCTLVCHGELQLFFFLLPLPACRVCHQHGQVPWSGLAWSHLFTSGVPLWYAPNLPSAASTSCLQSMRPTWPSSWRPRPRS